MIDNTDIARFIYNNSKYKKDPSWDTVNKDLRVKAVEQLFTNGSFMIGRGPVSASDAAAMATLYYRNLHHFAALYTAPGQVPEYVSYPDARRKRLAGAMRKLARTYDVRLAGRG